MASLDPTESAKGNTQLPSFNYLEIETPTMISILNAVSATRQLGDMMLYHSSSPPSTANEDNTPEVFKEDPTSTTQLLYSEIPTRVKCGVKRSSIPETGRGRFVQNKTAEGR
jgi:hypothetical protein